VHVIVGDQSQAEGLKVVAHVCDDPNAWGKGFVVAICRSGRSPNALAARYEGSVRIRVSE